MGEIEEQRGRLYDFISDYQDRDIVMMYYDDLVSKLGEARAYRDLLLEQRAAPGCAHSFIPLIGGCQCKRCGKQYTWDAGLTAVEFAKPDVLVGLDIRQPCDEMCCKCFECGSAITRDFRGDFCPHCTKKEP